MLKWVDDDFDITLDHAEIAMALGKLIYPVMTKDFPNVYNLRRLEETIMMHEHRTIVKGICQMFLDKFDPSDPTPAKERLKKLDEREQELMQMIFKEVQGDLHMNVLLKLIDAVSNSLRSNVFLDRRYGLSIRINGAFVLSKQEHLNNKEVPYGVFFVTGKRCTAYQMRFREIARGGLRLVPAEAPDRYRSLTSAIVDECYGLAYAQQQKNKDIPEGGSKAVMVCDLSGPLGTTDMKFRRSVQIFGDSILDLITPDPAIKDRLIDYWGQDELIYLGPDENVIPDDIVWLTQRADQRGMKHPSAFMSSKPGAGINHKEFGITSEGVNVFLELALKEGRGINPRETPHRIKMTGGPNGDVAGNMIRICHREYGANTSWVGLADGTGCVEDPNGLDIDELLRLHVEDLPISSFDTTKLGASGAIYYADPNDTRYTKEGAQMRNTMHNRVEAEAFFPAGGRPNTINENNWTEYLREDGKPSADLIVEAANIFTTPGARTKLGESGVMIVKDSSANKAGVCCSSYEIISGMLLNEEEFMAIKPALVEDVVELLRTSARNEAELLFRYNKLNPSADMVQYAVKISNAINRANDAIAHELKSRPVNDEMRKRLCREHAPKKLIEVVGDRLATDLPDAYVRQLLSATLSSRMVYKEGVEWINAQSESTLGAFSKMYLDKSDRIEEILREIEDSDLSGKADVLQLLRASGVRTAMELGLDGDNSYHLF